MLLNRDLQKRPEVLRDSSPETNTGPYWVCEKFKFGTFHCPCSLLGVSDGRAISDEYRTQTVRFRSYLLPVLLTLLNWSTIVLVLRVHSQKMKSTVITAVGSDVSKSKGPVCTGDRLPWL